MKKLLLSLAVMAFSANVINATEYVLFSADNYNNLEWTGGNSGYKTTVTVDGKTFTLETQKSKSTSNLIKPGDQIRVYKNADFVISSNDFKFKQVTLTGMSNYAGAQTVSDGWSTSADGLVTTLVNESGSNTVTFSATANQFRVTKIVVSDVIGAANPDPEPQTVKVNSIAEVKALATKTKVEVNFPMTVAFVNFSNVYVYDAAGDFIQIYGSNTLKNNDIIPAGWKAEYEFYNSNTPELKPEALPASTEQGNFVPKAVDADKITVDMVNSVILVKNVVLDAASPETKDNFTGKVGETTLSFRNNYTLPSVEAGTYDITVVVTIYQGAPSLYVINYAANGSGVEEIAADGAEAVYYNLQGVKVAEPTNGLYIKVQGKKATKVYINE